MLGFFRPPAFADPELGELRRARGHWRGLIALEGVGSVPLAIAGSRRAPDPTALQSARAASALLAKERASVEQAIFDHIQPYVEAIAAGELPMPGEPLPSVGSASDVWPHVSIRYVAVTPLGKKLVTEFGIAIPWDEEHTRGARFAGGEFVELCGSVLPP